MLGLEYLANWIVSFAIGPVSYTHLDVYKRQEQCSRHERCSEENGSFSCKTW